MDKKNLIELVATIYGPYAFGVISLLVVWFTIVGPQLERQAVDFNRNETLLESMREISGTMLTVSRSMERTATALDRIVEKQDDMKVHFDN